MSVMYFAVLCLLLFSPSRTASFSCMHLKHVICCNRAVGSKTGGRFMFGDGTRCVSKLEMQLFGGEVVVGFMFVFFFFSLITAAAFRKSLSGQQWWDISQLPLAVAGHSAKCEWLFKGSLVMASFWFEHPSPHGMHKASFLPQRESPKWGSKLSGVRARERSAALWSASSVGNSNKTLLDVKGL